MADEDKPANPGHANLEKGKRFEAGKSGNPGGRPKDIGAFRKKARKLTNELLDVIRKRMTDTDVPLADLVRALEACADRGGYLGADKEATLATQQARLVLAAFALDGMKLETKKKLLRSLGVTDELG